MSSAHILPHYPSIAFTQRHLDSSNGGEERSLFTIIKELSRLGYSTTLFYKEFGDFISELQQTESYPYLDFELSRANFKSFFKGVLKASNIIKKREIQILYVNSYKDITWAALVKVLSGCKIVLHLRLNAPEYLSRQYAWGLSYVDHFIANSRFVAHDWSRYVSRPIEVIWNAIEKEQSPELPEDEIDLLFIGRLVKEKGLHLAIEALNYLPKHRKLHVIGDFKQSLERGDQDYQNEIKNQITTLGLQHRVHFLGHKVSVQGFIQNANTLLVPSYFDSFGRTLMEAIIIGTPVVASACGGTLDLQDVLGQNQLKLFKEGDSHDLAHAISAITSIRAPIIKSENSLFQLEELISNLTASFHQICA